MTPLTKAELLIAAGLVCLLAAIRVLIKQRRFLEMVPASNVTIELPTKWDDGEITRFLQRYHDQPAVLSHVVSSIKTRMVLNQDLKTAQQRLKLIASVIEVFKLNKELQGIVYDIHLAEKDFEIHKIEREMGKEDAEARLKSERQLRELRKQRDELQLKKEITQLQQDIKTADTATTTESKPSPEQQRAKDKAACEARIQTLKQEKQNALKLEDADERVQKVNAIDDALQREMERWAKLL
jgi:hypothetical protein